MTWGDLDWDDTPNPKRRAANQAANLVRQAEAKENARIAREERRAANRRAFATARKRRSESTRLGSSLQPAKNDPNG